MDLSRPHHRVCAILQINSNQGREHTEVLKVVSDVEVEVEEGGGVLGVTGSGVTVTVTCHRKKSKRLPEGATGKTALRHRLRKVRNRR
jgi:ABC-type glutathione transport system ATPase component